MVSKSFDINTTSLQPFDPETRRLLIELSPESVAVILWNRKKRLSEAVEIFKGAHTTTGDWEDIIQQSSLLGFTDVETLLVIAYPEIMPVPAALYTPLSAKDQLELFFGRKHDTYTSGDVLKQYDMVVSWQMPGSVQTFVKSRFRLLQVKHLVSLLIENYKRWSQFDGHIVLYGNIVWAVLWVDGKLQIAKPVCFTKPEDLSWHLLNICREFEVSPASVHWKVSGMAESSSPLWQAIARFLDPVVAMDAGTPKQEELAGHYFAHLFVALEN